MSITTLFGRLNGQAEITLDQATMGAEGALLLAQLPELGDTEIKITVSQGPSYTSAAQTAFSLQGSSVDPVLGIPNAAISLLAEDVAGSIHFKLDLSTPANWTLGSSFKELSFGELEVLQFAQAPVFSLCTRELAAEKLKQGLNWAANVQLSGSLAKVLEFVPGATNPLPLLGIIHRTDSGRIIDLKAELSTASINLAVPGWVGMNFSHPALALRCQTFRNDQAVIQKLIEADVVITGNGKTSQSLPMALALPSSISGWQLQLQANEGISIGGLLDFLGMMASAGQFDFESQFTDSSGIFDRIKAISNAFKIRQLYADFGGSITSPSLNAFGFGINSPGSHWEIIPSVLGLEDLGINLSVTKQGTQWETRGFLQGDISFDSGLKLHANFPIPPGSGNWTFKSLHQVPLSSLNILSKFTDGSPIDALLPDTLRSVGQFELYSLDLEFSPAQAKLKKVEFEVKSKDSWEIIPDRFSLDSLFLEISLNNGNDGWELSGLVRSELHAGSVEITAGAAKLSPESDWYFNLHANEVPLPTLAELGNLIGGENALSEALPDSLLNAELFLSDPRLNVNLSQKRIEEFGFNLHTEHVDFGIFQLQEAGLSADIQFGAGREVKVYGKFTIDDIDFNLECQYNNANGWDIQGFAAQTHPIQMGALITKLAGHFGFADDVPAVLQSIELSHIALSYNTQSKDFNFSMVASIQLDNKELDAQLSLQVLHNNGSYTRKFSGIITIGELEFDLIFAESQGQEPILLAAYENPAGKDQSIRPLVELITDNADILNAAQGITINLKNALLVVDKGSTTKLLFGLDIGGGIDLSKLPLLGKSLPANASAKVLLQPLISSHDFSKAELDRIRPLVPVGGYQLPQEVTDRLDLNIKLSLGEQSFDLSLPIAANDVKSQPGSSTLPASTSASQDSTTAAPPSATDGIKWFQIQKKLGPIQLKRAGVQFQNSQIYLLLDTDLALAGLTLSLDGLFVSSTISPIHPKFGLHGIGIDYKNGPLEIGGAFLRETLTDGQGNSYDSYEGTALIKTEKFALAALGSYAYYQGHPSLFVYAFVDAPLGGPAFFFVTGLAGGFGYNRRLVMPELSGVKSFPLVAEAIAGTPGSNGDLNGELAKLHNVIPPALGEYFLALGIRFTSFEIIDSFALLNVSFGQDFEVDVLGLSTLVLPKPAPGSSAKPLAEVQMALKAVFNPGKGFLKVQAGLTPASYFLSRDCHLTGGFAFYTWFKDDPSDGASAGDFALSLGGYHPSFRPPAHYPRVAPLGFNWRVTSKLNIKGNCYFALVPHAAMAGGNLSATWESGNLSAWFDVGADFMISWKPYHYDASFHLSMGVSYTYHFFGKHHIRVHVGADLHVWGPEFSGRAHVHLWIVSFTVSFGANSSQSPQKLNWDEFRTGFLPTTNKWANALVTKGLLRQLGDDADPLFVINPKEFKMETVGALPANHSNRALDGCNASINIGAMKIADDSLVTKHNVTVFRDGQDVSADFNFQPIQKHVPGALWGKKFQHDPNEDENHRLVKNVCTGFEITGKPVQASDVSHDIDSQKLLNEEETFDKPVEFATGKNLGGVFLKSNGVRGQVAANLEARDAIRASMLNKLGFKDRYQPQSSIAQEFILTVN